ncbi:MAG: hypothetical protein DRN81_02010 [Thermoproteota archaeon]|nr:MAG: hypothetical protein DRN81_02010 [Candidatus Korarchaeota archaeon]
MGKKVWTSKGWFNESKKEFNEYKKSKNPRKLAQAGEKLWNSLSLYIDEKTGKRMINFSEIRKEAHKDPEIRKFFDDAYWLHIFFYRGFTEDIGIEEGKFKRVSTWLGKKILRSVA